MKNKASKRIGHKMAAVLSYVERHPGCTMIDAARHVHPFPSNFSRSCALGYNPVHRAIRAGLVRKTPGARKGSYSLQAVA